MTTTALSDPSRAHARETDPAPKPSRARARRAPRPKALLREAVLDALQYGGTSTQVALNARARRVSVEEVLAELEQEGLARRSWMGWQPITEGTSTPPGQSGTRTSTRVDHPCFGGVLPA